MENYAIALDGPSGSGKSTVAKSIAKRLGILYLDTGAMYRAVGLNALMCGVDTRDWKSVEKVLEKTDVRVAYADSGQRIYLNGEDVTDKIRTPEVSRAASDVSAVPAVRLAMVELQREIAKSASVVMDGRDIGTYVLPNAKYKFFLTAAPEERARRRHAELEAKGLICSYEDVLREMLERDKNDSSRELAPLKKAGDAELVDTTNMTVEQVIEHIIGKVTAE